MRVGAPAAPCTSESESGQTWTVVYRGPSLTGVDPGHIWQGEASMPTYEYACSSCGNAWEEIQKDHRARGGGLPGLPQNHGQAANQRGQLHSERGRVVLGLVRFVPEELGSKDDSSSKSSEGSSSGGDKAGGGETKSEGTKPSETKSDSKKDGGSSSGSSGSSGSGGGTTKSAD